LLAFEQVLPLLLLFLKYSCGLYHEKAPTVIYKGGAIYGARVVIN